METQPTKPPSGEVGSGEWGGLNPGDVVGVYTLVSPLGEGGFGAIYLAEQSSPVRRRVAMKFLKAGLDSLGVLARFEAERQALAIMDHPNIAKVFDAGATPAGRPYFVMEYVPGVAITEYCDREKLGLRDRLALFLDVCEAVAHAHAKGVIHRDLKPSNILVSRPEAGERVVKVIDFGIAKAVQRAGRHEAQVTEAGAFIGTPEYMSPEQADGSQDIDTGTDVYALGVVLYELLAGVLPFDPRELRAKGEYEIRRIIREVEPPRPSTRLGQGATAERAASVRGVRVEELARSLRSELEWIPLRAMRKSRKERYRSPLDLADDIRNYLAGRPLIAGPESVFYKMSKFARRNRAGVFAGGAVAAALVGGMGVAMYASVEAGRARREAELTTAFLSDMLSAATPEGRGREVPMRVVLDRASGTIASRMRDVPRAEASIRRTIGQAYQSLGEFDRAAEHIERAYEIRRAELGASHPDTVRAMADIAGLRINQGRYEESATMSREALEAWRGDPNAFVPVGIKNNLAAAYARLGRANEAIEMQREAVVGLAAAMGPRHPHTLGATMNLASLLTDRGDVQEAERLLVGLIESWRQAVPEDHPGATLARSELAGLYMKTGRLREAEATYRAVLAIEVGALGEDHPSTARTRANLGLVLEKQERVDEAREELERAWRVLHDALGPGHADTMSVASSLLSMYESADWPDAVRAMVPALVQTLRAVAADETASPTMLNDAAWFLLHAQPPSERDPGLALQASWRACERAKAGGDPLLWSYLDTLALAQARTGANAEAATTQRRALELLPKSDEHYRAEMTARLHEYERGDAGGRGD
ncbi:MAG: serine/threonine-protein kinase [Planctomycetota bacterium]|nr:serine/threonine-protein kinase [Planctomycetota bacterium]